MSINKERTEAIPIENGVFQSINGKIEELSAEQTRLSCLPIDTRSLQEKIQTELRSLYASISSVKNLLSFKSETLDRLDELLKQTKSVQ